MCARDRICSHLRSAAGCGFLRAGRPREVSVDTIADMGGLQGFGGPVVVEENEPPFHEEWERRAFAMALLA
ncbi:MAG: hypothetical protein ACRDJO_01695, partial [Actinomycetota bacterium]